jgi:hypothetical protein
MPQLRPSPAAVRMGFTPSRTYGHIRRALLAYQVGIWLLAIWISST